MRHSQEIMIVAISIDLVKNILFPLVFIFLSTFLLILEIFLFPYINFKIIPCFRDGLLL